MSGLNDYVLLVLHKLEGRLTAFRVGDGQALFSVSTSPYPHEMCLSPDRRRVFISEYGLRGVESSGRGGTTVAILDLATARRIGTLDTSPHERPHGITTHPSGQLWVTVEAAGRVMSFDLQSGALRFAVETGGHIPHNVAVCPDGSFAAVAHVGSHDVTFIDSATGALRGRVEVGVRPEGMVFSRDGARLYVVNRESDSLSIVDLAAGKVVHSIATGRGPVRLQATPDGRRLILPLFFADAAQIIDVERERVLATLNVGRQPAGTTVSPDGRLAFFSCEEERAVSVVSLQDLCVVGRISTGEGPDAMQCLTAAEYAALGNASGA